MRGLLLCGVAAVLVAAAVAARPAWHELRGYTFERYEKDFGKTYASPAEREQRRAVFAARLAEIDAHNAAGRSWKMGVNHLTDRTPEEHRRLNGARVAATSHSRKLLAKKHGAQVVGSSDFPLPTSFDWRNRVPSVLTGIKNQGGCGDCWANAAVEAMESAVAIQTGDLYVLSVQQITSCTPSVNGCGGTGGCNGNICEAAFSYAAENGVAEEWTYPFTSGVTQDSGVCLNASLRPVVKLSGYMNSEPNDQVALMQNLITYGPLAISADASGWGSYESGIYAGCDYSKNISMDHAIQLVGWGVEPSTKEGYWVIRNSWSARWGEHGYMRVHRDLDATKPACGWNVHTEAGIACKPYPQEQWVCGQCGILFSTSFPLVSV